jgi:hypothetical protein
VNPSRKKLLECILCLFVAIKGNNRDRHKKAQKRQDGFSLAVYNMGSELLLQRVFGYPVVIKMKSIEMNLCVVCAALALAAEAALASGKIDFSRYDVILSRKPFGEPPAEATAQPAVPAAAAFVKDIRMCAITESVEFGIRVGFVDIAAKKNYYLRVGDTEDGIQLVDADYEKEAALLQKGSESYWINMTGQVNPGSSGPDQFGATGAPALPTTAISSLAPDRMSSYTERVKRRRQAMEERRRQQEEQAKQQPALSAEEKEKLLKEYQMELIRAGGEKGPALPVPLTKEMDDQLVAEGVLPPIDGGEAPAGENPPPPDALPPPGAPAQ